MEEPWKFILSDHLLNYIKISAIYLSLYSYNNELKFFDLPKILKDFDIIHTDQ